MRRKDREVTDFSEILKIVDACEILRLGLSDGAFPYIVPVNFAYEVREGQLYFYLHGAMAGRKYELLRKDPRCAFEMDRPLGLELIPERGDVTMRYQSVMGTGEVEFLEGEVRQQAIDQVIMARFPETWDFAYNQKAVKHTAVLRLKVLELTAKANLPRSGADL